MQGMSAVVSHFAVTSLPGPPTECACLCCTTPFTLTTSSPELGSATRGRLPCPPPFCSSVPSVLCGALLSAGSDGKSICLQCRRPGFNPWVRKTPWRRKWQPTPVFLPGESHERRRLAGYNLWGRRVGRLSTGTSIIPLMILHFINNCSGDRVF